jgi:hypothetical protein
MKLEELMQKYQQLTTAPVDPSLLSESGESVTSLMQTSSLRILLLRTASDPKTVTIEVEAWLPHRDTEYFEEVPTDSQDKSENDDLGHILSRLIEVLQYLLQLHQSGFTLDVIRHDCLWTASRSFSKPPSQKVFELLLPPG